VRKGERGIAILAPLVRRKTEEEPTDDKVRVVTGFRIVHVFAIDQTDGPELPSEQLPPVRVPDLQLRDQLIDTVRQSGIIVRLVPDDGSGARGWFAWQTNTISIIESYPLASQVRTLLHELAHSCDPGVRKPDRDRAERELIAESSAYLVGRDMGLDMDDASTYYVMTWGADQPRLLALATEVLAVAREVDRLTSQLPLPGLTA
jgi:antirestriction protein ArdC